MPRGEFTWLDYVDECGGKWLRTQTSFSNNVETPQSYMNYVDDPTVRAF